LQVIVEQIRRLNHSIVKLEEVIDREGKKLKGHRNLTSIKGIGSLGASILLSVIGDVRDFPDEGRLASYFGIVPRIHNSNETERSGGITKRGSKLGRTALVQCALIAKRYSPYLASYYEQIRSRRGTGRAIIALARKFLGIIYRTLKNNWIFD
jgi:transposase